MSSAETIVISSRKFLSKRMWIVVRGNLYSSALEQELEISWHVSLTLGEILTWISTWTRLSKRESQCWRRLGCRGISTDFPSSDPSHKYWTSSTRAGQWRRWWQERRYVQWPGWLRSISEWVGSAVRPQSFCARTEEDPSAHGECFCALSQQLSHATARNPKRRRFCGNRDSAYCQELQ